MSDCRSQDQTKVVLKHLRRYRRIDSMKAFGMYNITRLADVIWRLRRQGHVITTELVAKPRTRYAIYRLAK